MSGPCPTSSTQQQQPNGCGATEALRSPKPAVGGSSLSTHANRGRSHGHRTRALAERPGRSGTGLTVTRPWGTSPDPDLPPDGGRSGGELNSGQHQAGAGPESGAVACRRSDRDGDIAGPALRQSVGRIAAIAAGCNPVAFVGIAGSSPARRTRSTGGASRRQATAAVSKTEGPMGVRVRSSPPPLMLLRGRWSARRVVSAEIAGSSPVGSAHAAVALVGRGRPPFKRDRGTRVRLPSAALGKVTSGGPTPGC